MSIFQKVLFQGVSSFNGDIKVVEASGERRLVASFYTQSKTLNKHGKTGSYWDGFVEKVADLNKDSRILILGLAAGTIAKLYTNKFGPVTIDGVEIDPLMVELGREYFDFNEKNVNVIIGDALIYVREARYKYDVIGVDLFAKGGHAVANDSEDFFASVKNLLNPGGVVVINKIFLSKEELDEYLQFLKGVFTRTDNLLIRESGYVGNVVVYAYTD